MMRFFIGLFFVLILIVALCFSLINFQLITINLYFTSIKMPLAVALTIELIVGIMIGFFVAFVRILKLKSEYKYLSRQVSKAREVAALD